MGADNTFGETHFNPDPPAKKVQWSRYGPLGNISQSPLPPAEGAEQRIRVRNILQDFYRRGEYELEQAEEDIMRLFQPQPTAEGAEEILDKYPHSTEYPSFVHENSAIDAMTEFATLHAQRIADKMVSEKYDELLQQRDELKEALINMMVVVRDCYPLLFDNEKPAVKQAEAAIKNTEKR